MKTTLITGAYGFVGGYLSDYISSKGNKVIRSGIELDSEVILDVCNSESCKEVLSKYKPDSIIHLAGFSSVKNSYKNPELCKKINVDGTKNLLNAVRKFSSKTKVLIISSSEVYGSPKYLPIDEKHPLHGINPYAKSRITQEKLVIDEFSDINIVISRSFNHTGPAQQKGFVLPDFASQIAEILRLKTSPIIHVGNLEAERDFLDVRDVVKAYYLLITKNTKSKIYNICSGKVYKISEILGSLIKLSGEDIKIVVDVEKYRPLEILKYYGSHEKITKELGWSPIIPFEQTIKDTFTYWMENKLS
ncbi:MAG: GDP-mannose 4,6-dehydratase [bacterium]